MAIRSTASLLKVLLKKLCSFEQGGSIIQKNRWIILLLENYFHFFPSMGIWGFMPPEEIFALSNAIHGQFGDKRITAVEIGSWQGKSSVIIAKEISNDSRLYCIDPFIPDAPKEKTKQRLTNEGIYNSEDMKARFLENVQRYGVSHKVECLQGYSHIFAGQWNKPIDFLFIDGDHSEKGVERDFLDWSPFLVSGGLCAFHDTWLKRIDRSRFDGIFPDGPAKIVERHILSNPERWAVYEYIGSLFIAERK